MYLINTSFHIHRDIADDVLSQVRTRLMTDMERSGIFSNLLLADILVEVDPESRSFTLQGFATDLQKGLDMLMSNPFFGDLQQKYGKKTLFFTTPMKVLDGRS